MEPTVPVSVQIGYQCLYRTMVKASLLHDWSPCLFVGTAFDTDFIEFPYLAPSSNPLHNLPHFSTLPTLVHNSSNVSYLRHPRVLFASPPISPKTRKCPDIGNPSHLRHLRRDIVSDPSGSDAKSLARASADTAFVCHHFLHSGPPSAAFDPTNQHQWGYHPSHPCRVSHHPATHPMRTTPTAASQKPSW